MPPPPPHDLPVRLEGCCGVQFCGDDRSLVSGVILVIRNHERKRLRSLRSSAFAFGALLPEMVFLRPAPDFLFHDVAVEWLAVAGFMTERSWCLQPPAACRLPLVTEFISHYTCQVVDSTLISGIPRSCVVIARTVP